jgi:hypothetical protein
VTLERFEDFLGELPQFAPDPRQSMEVGFGWPASAPDLGFIQNAADRLSGLGKLDVCNRQNVATLVRWAVQRVKRVTLTKESDHVYVRFWSQDDRGSYEHGFPIQLP